MAGRYRVYNMQEKLLAEGTITEIADKLGMKRTAVQSSIYRARDGVPSKKLIIEEITVGEYPNKDVGSELQTIAAWDAFVTPLRQRYNIPVYKAKPEVRK